MRIKKDQLTFPSTAHKSIWHTFLFMSPFYEIIPKKIINEENQKLIKGERDFYDFMTRLYSDMYKNPANYFIPTIEYDKYMKSRLIGNLIHNNDSRECTLRNRFQKSIKFYQDFLYDIGRYGEVNLSSFNLTLSESKLREIVNKFTITKNDEDHFKRIDTLKLIGLDYKRLNKRILFFNNDLPLMFIGLELLSKSKNIKYGYTCYLLCDFRGILENFKIKFEDTLFILDDDLKKIVNEMNEIMIQINTKLKIKPLRNTQLNSFWKLQYSKNGKAVSTFHIDINKIDYFINFNNVENISKIGYQLRSRSIELYNWFFDHIKSVKCSCKNKRNVDIGGIKKRICGLMNRLEIFNPKRSDLEKMKDILKMFHFETF